MLLKKDHVPADVWFPLKPWGCREVSRVTAGVSYLWSPLRNTVGWEGQELRPCYCNHCMFWPRTPHASVLSRTPEEMVERCKRVGSGAQVFRDNFPEPPSVDAELLPSANPRRNVEEVMRAYGVDMADVDTLDIKSDSAMKRAEQNHACFMHFLGCCQGGLPLTDSMHFFHCWRPTALSSSFFAFFLPGVLHQQVFLNIYRCGKCFSRLQLCSFICILLCFGLTVYTVYEEQGE